MLYPWRICHNFHGWIWMNFISKAHKITPKVYQQKTFNYVEDQGRTFVDFLIWSFNVFIWYQVAKWSRGMISALVAGGPGFKSRFGPTFCVLRIKLLCIVNNLCAYAFLVVTNLSSLIYGLNFISRKCMDAWNTFVISSLSFSSLRVSMFIKHNNIYKINSFPMF